jgi:galactofuranosylgalactofuranosylrhamnosyl-N-acetylglucosaminyl-diphospho-decaprenol beta-1,5/1,6-galactofuranosyltransferase
LSRQTLQTIVFPHERSADRTSLYARWPDGSVGLADHAAALPVAAKATVDFATFFNCFSHRKWAAVTLVERVWLQLNGQGRVRIKIFAINGHGVALPIAEQIRTLDQKGVEVALGDIKSIPGEILAFSVRAEGSGVRLEHAAWTTNQPPARTVSLAAVITTFRRETAVLGAIDKFCTTIIPRSRQAAIHLYVVDNGRTLEPVSAEGVTIIPNRNLGGAGGFTRGLLHARDAMKHTHVLFMDDDAECEPESVHRTVALAAYLRDPRASISGAMLYTDRPTVQHEKGALYRHRGKFDRFLELQNSGYELSRAEVVAANDGPDDINYGAWWFFAFPLSAIQKLPFPFFVRGDDIDFSIANRLPVVTLNGIATWSGDFDAKHTPATEFLATRAWVATSVLHGDVQAATRIFRRHRRLATNFGLRLDYPNMNAVVEAIELVCRGPAAFGKDPAPTAFLNALNRDARVAPMTAADFRSMSSASHSAPRRSLLGRVLLGGYLRGKTDNPNLPYGPVSHTIPKWSLFAHDRVAYGKGQNVRVFRRSRSRMLSLWARSLRLGLTLQWRIPKLIRIYREEAKQYRSEQYWRSQFEADT